MIAQKLKAFVGFILLLFLVGSLTAQTKLADKLPIDPNVKIGKLSNGLTYYIRKNNRPEKKIELRLVVNAGSILEDDDQQGLAHFTEHMSFNGSKNFKKNDLVSFLQSIGVEFGADLNAYTSFDETVYILPIPSEKKENVEKGFQILEDWASTVAFDNTEIDKERGVVLEESRLGKGANDRMQKVYLPKILEGSKYALRLPIGKDDILKNFKYDVVKRFYKDWYRPDLMAVVVVGDIDPAEAEKIIKAHFETLKNPVKERARISGELPARTKSEGLVVTDKEATHHYIQIYYSTTKSKPDVTISDYRESMVKNFFTSMLSQRLQELTQKPNPPFIYGASSLDDFLRGHEVYASVAVLGKGGVEPALNAIIEENERARKFGFTANELDRVKKTVLRGMEQAYNEREKSESSGYAQEYIRAFLSQEAIPGIENEYNYYKEYAEGITLDEVNKYAASIIPTIDKNKLVLFTGPDKAEFKIPTNQELLTMTENASKTEVKAYEEKAVAASLMDKAPVAGKIVSEKQNKDLGTTELTLSNGINVILKPTDFKNDHVVMTATRFGGQFLYENKDRLNAEYAVTTVAQMGVGSFSPVDLRKVLAGKSVSVSPKIGTISETVSGQSGSKDIESMLQLNYLYFTQPRKDNELFSSFVSKQQAIYQNVMSDPNAVYQDSLLTTVYKKHARAPRIPRSEDFGKINVDRALEIYKDRFGNANGFTFIFVGSFDIAAIKPLIETYLASLPSSPRTAAFHDVGLRPSKGVINKKVYKGTEAKSMINISFFGEKPYSNDEQLKLQALIELLNIKVIETLREDMSGVYGAGVYGGLNKNPYNNYSLTITMPCGPENVDKLVKASFDEVQKVKDNGPSEVDLNKVKETWKKQYEVDIKDNTFWAKKLQSAVEIGSDAGEVLSFEKRVDALTPKDLKDAANKYFDMKNFIQVVLYPEK
ncbi:MAG TPA: insulinase family protein [Cyclobacteriaceae bacterium]|nr:insulinase family protein [Cyclobacteriaceae bacterium]